MSLFQVIPHEYDRIVHLHFETQYHLTSSFVRMQEFYESPFPEIRGKVFSLIEFMDRYVEDSESNEFTYFTDWAGFNIPGSVLADFVSQYSRYSADDMNQKEWDIWGKVSHFAKAGNNDYYVIGTYGDEVALVEHELAHAYYYLNPVYKKFCDEIYADIEPAVKAKVTSTLLEMGYTEDVIEDETQAYFATDTEAKLRERFGLKKDKLGPIRERYAKNLKTVRTWKKSPF